MNTVAERIAQNTWEWLGQSWRFDTRLGEETLTDLLALDFAASASVSGYNIAGYDIKLHQTTKMEEAKQGADLVVYVQKGGTKAVIYAIQAKKLYVTKSLTKEYTYLNAKSGRSSRHQIDVLECFAKKVHAVPLYLLYNHVDGQYADQKYWHCCQDQMDKKQFGCTLAQLPLVRKAISQRGCRTFDYIHLLDDTTLPWRCAFDCPNREPWSKIREKANQSYRRHSHETSFFEERLGRWPSSLWNCETPNLTIEDIRLWYKEQNLEAPEPRSDIDNKPGYEYSSDFLTIPRWFMLVKPRG